MNNFSAQERRRYTRIPQRYLLQYTEINFPPEEIYSAVETKDISGNGLLFQSKEKISLGILLKIDLRLSGWDKYKAEFIKPDGWSSVSPPLTIIGKVVRVEEIIPERHYEIGISFENLDGGDKEALLKFLNTLEQENRRE